MKKYKKPLFIYLIFNLIFYAFTLASLSTLEYEQKSQTANATTRLIREKFLIKDFTGLTKDIEKIRSDNFTKIITQDKDNTVITQTVSSDELVNIKIKRSIWTDADKKHLKGHIVFYFSLDNLFILTLKLLLGSILVTLPLGIALLKHLRRQQLEAIEVEKNKVLNKFTKQMSHDIRSPIASLHHLLDLNRALDSQEMKIFKTSLDRIDHIANAYLDVSKNSYIAPMNNNLKEILTEISIEKMNELKGLDIILKLHDMDSIVVKEELKRILSNLINNSFDASKPNFKKIEISNYENSKSNIIKIQDFGSGIPAHVLNQIGSKEITTKAKGNGLGLLHAIETLKEWNAELKVVQTGEEGTIIELIFPKIKQIVVLIDDDELVRLTWDSKAKRQNIELRTFSSYELFLKSKDSIDRNSKIYIDSELGEQLKGEDIALILSKEGFIDISLATGHSQEQFRHLSFLKSIISKAPPF